MTKRIGRDKGLEAIWSNVVNEGDLFIFEVDYQHVVYYVEQRKAIGWQFDGDGLMGVLFGDWSEN
jgi:hypothetical protein